nr:MAG TPA: hypothetical protein [Caudoviricetes sp.]DAY22543.1 MAG TPA: hypothetical protein [Bacteriophage sp.]
MASLQLNILSVHGILTKSRSLDATESVRLGCK